MSDNLDPLSDGLGSTPDNLDDVYDVAGAEEVEKPNRPASPVKPLPRLWKTETDEAESESPGRDAAASYREEVIQGI